MLPGARPNSPVALTGGWVDAAGGADDGDTKGPDEDAAGDGDVDVDVATVESAAADVTTEAGRPLPAATTRSGVADGDQKPAKAIAVSAPASNTAAPAT